MIRFPLLLLAIAVLAVGGTVARADAPPFRAGITHITVQDTEPFDTTIWYPTNVPEATFHAGLFPIAAARDAAIAAGQHFPVVLLSHGRRGSPLGHRDLAAHLAREGFIVVAPIHIGNSSQPAPPRPQLQILQDRPRQAHLALKAALADPRFTHSVDTARIGAIGFSAGGYTVLVLAGARPDFALAVAYCQAHPDDRGSCGVPGATHRAGPAPTMAIDPAVADPRIKALVVMDPLAILFDAKGLAAVRMPVLLFRPQSDDYLSDAGNALALAAALPSPPRQIVVPGSHFVFIDPCPPALLEEVPAICKDAPGVDRAAIHQRIETEITSFLRKGL